MSSLPSINASAVAGTHLAQTTGSDKSEAADQTSNQVAQQKAEGTPEIQDPEQTGDRDADGRDLSRRNHEQTTAEDPANEESTADHPARQSLDPTGNTGQQIDLTG